MEKSLVENVLGRFQPAVVWLTLSHSSKATHLILYFVSCYLLCSRQVCLSAQRFITK